MHSALSEEEKENYILLSKPRSYENITALEAINELKLDFAKNRLRAMRKERNGERHSRRP